MSEDTSFEQAQRELERIVVELEGGRASLEDALALWERGGELYRYCVGKLVLLEHVRGDGRTARWQDRLTPLHRKVAGNCRLNRDTRAAVAAAGFDAAGIESTRLPGTHPLVRPGIQGVATKTSS